MTDDRTLERAARSWLEEGPTRAPDRAVDAALSRIQTTRQERELRLPWRTPAMTRYLLPLAAALIVAVGAAYLLFRPTSSVGPVGPSPTPIATPTARATPQPDPTPLQIRTTDGGRTLTPGAYHVPFFAAPFTVTLGGGWTVADAFANNVVFRNDGTNDFLTLVVLNGIYPDPCHLEGGATPFSGTPAELIAALGAMTGFEVTDVKDATVDAAPGKAFTLSNAIDLAAAGCTNQEVLSIGTYDDDGKNVDVLFGAPDTEPLWIISVSGLNILIGGPASSIEAINFDATGLFQ